MKSIIIIAIIGINIYSIVLSLKMLKGFDTERKVFLIAFNEIINFILLLIMYTFSASDVPEEIHKHSKTMIIMTMLPINVMISSSTILNLMNKMKFKEISENKFNIEMLTSILTIIIIIIAETKYMHDTQIDITNMAKHTR